MTNLQYHGYAVVSLFSRPDANRLQKSHSTVWECKYQGELNIHAVNVTQILSVVAMIPKCTITAAGVQYSAETFIMLEKIGFNVADGLEHAENGDDKDRELGDLILEEDIA